MLLKLENVKKEYQKFSLHCSLQLEAGRVTGLIGQNGAGKSTTFKAILDLIRPESGTIEVFGQSPNTLNKEQKEKIGVVMADAGFSGYLKVKDIIPVMKQFFKNFDREWFLSQCTKFELPMDKKIKDFSTGMRAKLKVLLAMSHKADLLILDEPTAGLDVVAREELLDLLRSYMEQNENCGILISSHISSDLEGLCDDIYMIDQGKIVLHEDTDVLLGEYGVLKVTEDQLKAMDQQYILKRKKENYGYQCLTDQKQFYLENYPGYTVEKGTIDEVIALMIQGV